MATPVSFQAGIYLCGETQNSTWLSRIHDAFKLFIVCLITWAAAKDRCWARAFKFLTAQQYHKPRKSAELLNFSHFAGSEGFSDCLESFFAVMLEELISGIFCIGIFALTSQNFHKMLFKFCITADFVHHSQTITLQSTSFEYYWIYCQCFCFNFHDCILHSFMSPVILSVIAS